MSSRVMQLRKVMFWVFSKWNLTISMLHTTVQNIVRQLLSRVGHPMLYHGVWSMGDLSPSLSSIGCPAHANSLRSIFRHLKTSNQSIWKQSTDHLMNLKNWNTTFCQLKIFSSFQCNRRLIANHLVLRFLQEDDDSCLVLFACFNDQLF